jgi:hypothetical protein
MVVPGISKGATDVTTGSEGENLLSLQGSNHPYAGGNQGLGLAVSKSEPVQSSQSATITTTATAGILADLIVKYDYHDPEIKPHWGEGIFYFIYSDHATRMAGTLTNETFHGLWDYTTTDGHFYGTMDITLDAGIGNVTKIVAFSANDNFEASGGVHMAKNIGGVNVPLVYKGASLLRFESDGAATCQAVTSFDSQSVDHGETLSLTGPQCDSKSKVVIEFTIQDPCLGKIPLPKGIEAFNLAGVSFSDANVPRAILGSNPEEISPIGFGAKTADGSPSSYEVKLCPFEKPVDIYLYFDLVWGDYYLNQGNQVRPKNKGGPWRANVTGALNEGIPGDFGGLFNRGRIPKGDDHVLTIIVVPAGVNVNEAKDAYAWTYMMSVKCEESIPVPQGADYFEINQLPALPVTGSNPEQIIPFYVGDYALGGELLLIGAYFCHFHDKDTPDFHVDLHFGIYCPEDDPLNLYFVNGDAKEEKDLFQKVSLLKFNSSPKLPARAYFEKCSYDDYQTDQKTFFGGLGLADLLPKGNCHYVLAVTPVGVRDRIYAWDLPLDINIKKAFIDNWKQSQKTDGSIQEKRPGRFSRKGGIK